MNLKALVATIALLLSPSTSSESPNHTFNIEGEIGGDTLLMVLSEIENAKGAGATRLTIHFNSPGGSVGAGLVIMRAIIDSGMSTTCVVDEFAASMAAILLESPACQERIAHPWSLIMFHSAYTETSGNDVSLENTLTVVRSLNRAISYLIAPRLGLTPDEYEARIANGREWWIVGGDAVEQGVIDSLMFTVVPVPDVTLPPLSE